MKLFTYWSIFFILMNVTTVFSQKIDSATWLKTCVVNHDVSKVPRPLKKIIRRKYGDRFSMANPEDKFEAGDVEMPGLKERRLISTAKCSGKFLLLYEHGGYAYHRHIMVFDIKDDQYFLVTNSSIKKIDSLVMVFDFLNAGGGLQLDHF